MHSKTGICWLQTGSEERNLTRNHLKRVPSRSWHDDLRRKSLSMYVYTNLTRKQGCIVSNREKSGYTAMCIERCGTTGSSNRYASKICKMRRMYRVPKYTTPLSLALTHAGPVHHPSTSVRRYSAGMHCHIQRTV